jgi:hypothetical protein
MSPIFFVPGPVSIIVLGEKNLAQINILPRNCPRWGNFHKSVSINIFGPEFPQELPNFPPNVGQLLSCPRVGQFLGKFVLIKI